MRYWVFRTRQRGFTLIEVVIAISLLAVISVMVWASLSQTFALRKAIETSDLKMQGARIALGKMTADIEGAYLSTFKHPRLPVDRQPTKFVGTDKTLAFTSYAHVRLFKGVRESDQTELAYILEDRKEGGGKDLHRTEFKRVTPERDGAEKPEDLILMEGVSEFSLRYCDGNKGEWVTEWDTGKPEFIESPEPLKFQRRLPLAVEITLKFSTLVPEQGEEQPEESKDDLTTLKTIAFIQWSYARMQTSGGQKLIGCSDEKL